MDLLILDRVTKTRNRCTKVCSDSVTRFRFQYFSSCGNTDYCKVTWLLAWAMYSWNVSLHSCTRELIHNILRQSTFKIILK